jgi:FkbM family methyltransferase
VKFYGQYKQDKYLNQIFKGKSNGTFVDIGAHDGITFSNSYFFEKEKNWSGICVEPIPEIFKKLNQERNCIKINGCISNKIGTEKFLRVKGEFVDTEMLSGLVEDYDLRHIERIDREIKEYGGSKEEIEVTCYDINQVLIDNNINQVDFFTIDTEGNELKILKTINFDQFDFDIFIVENNYETNEINNLMTANGFKRIKKIGHDEVYRNKNKLSLFQKIFQLIYSKFP